MTFYGNPLPVGRAVAFEGDPSSVAVQALEDQLAGRGGFDPPSAGLESAILPNELTPQGAAWLPGTVRRSSD